MFSLICAWINGQVNKREAGDFRRHRANYGVTVMTKWYVIVDKSVPPITTIPHINKCIRQSIVITKELVNNTMHQPLLTYLQNAFKLL